VTRRIDPESLVLEDLTDAEREALLAEIAAEDAQRVERLADVLSSLDADDWRAAEVPALRFVPEGVGEVKPFWSRVCVRGDAGEHRVPAPLVALGLAVAMVLSGAVGFAVRGASDGGDPTVDARLMSAPAVSLVRAPAAPPDAGGIVRMVAGRDGRMMVRAHGLAPTGEGRWYEIWMKRDDRDMVSVGTFRVREDGTVDARFRTGVDPRAYPTMDVSLQTAADGKAHSGRSVLRSSPST